MFSKNEIEYLQGKKQASEGYKRYLRYSINKKLQHFSNQTLPLILENEATRNWFIQLVRENTNAVRENPNALQNQETPNSSFLLEIWCDRRDLNPG